MKFVICGLLFVGCGTDSVSALKSALSSNNLDEYSLEQALKKEGWMTLRMRRENPFPPGYPSIRWLHHHVDKDSTAFEFEIENPGFHGDDQERRIMNRKEREQLESTLAFQFDVLVQHAPELESDLRKFQARLQARNAAPSEALEVVTKLREKYPASLITGQPSGGDLHLFKANEDWTINAEDQFVLVSDEAYPVFTHQEFIDHVEAAEAP